LLTIWKINLLNFKIGKEESFDTDNSETLWKSENIKMKRKNNSIISEIERIVSLYRRTELSEAKRGYDGYINRILEDESKYNRRKLLDLYERDKIKEDLKWKN